MGKIAWEYRAFASPLSREYLMRLEFRQGGTPEIFAIDPDPVSLSAGRRVPHVYSEAPTRLCLYLPGAFEWEPWMHLDETLIPWAALWLHYFEDWLISDDWKGGGKHPHPEPSAADLRQSSLLIHRYRGLAR